MTGIKNLGGNNNGFCPTQSLHCDLRCYHISLWKKNTMVANDKTEIEYLVRTVCSTIEKSVIQGIQNNNKQNVHPGTIIGIVIGGLFCILGFILGCLGFSGAVEWVLSTGSLHSKISNASPGVLLCLMGMIILWRYRPRYRHEITIHPIEIKVSSEKGTAEIRGPKIESRSASSPISSR